MALPATYEEYLKEVNSKLNVIERITQSLSGTDERLDVTNQLLIELVKSITQLIGVSAQILSNITPVEKENPPQIAAQRKLVTTAGTAVQLPVVLIPYDKEAVIKAPVGNTGTIYIGNSKPEAEDHTLSYPLERGESVEYGIENLNQLWIDSTIDNEGIVWTVEQ